MALTDDAKAELAEAIRIVREDKFEAYARGVLGKHAPKDAPKDPLLDPNDPPKDPKDGPPAPPPKDDPKNDPKNDPPKEPKRSRYWGELMDD